MPDWSILPTARGFHPSRNGHRPKTTVQLRAGTVDTNRELQGIPPTRLLPFRERSNRLILRLHSSAETQGKGGAAALQHQLQQTKEKVVLILTEASIQHHGKRALRQCCNFIRSQNISIRQQLATFRQPGLNEQGSQNQEE